MTAPSLSAPSSPAAQPHLLRRLSGIVVLLTVVLTFIGGAVIHGALSSIAVTTGSLTSGNVTGLTLVASICVVLVPGLTLAFVMSAAGEAIEHRIR